MVRWVLFLHNRIVLGMGQKSHESKRYVYWGMFLFLFCAQTTCPRTHIPSTYQDMLCVHAALPPKALTGPLDTWEATVQQAPDARTLRTCLGTLEAAISDDVLSGEFQRDPLLVKGAWMPTGREVASAVPGVLTGQPLPLADSEERPVPEPVYREGAQYVCSVHGV